MNYKNDYGDKTKEKILSNISDSSIGTIIKYFASTLEENNINLQVFYHNLKKLDIKLMQCDYLTDILLFKILKWQAFYKYEENRIYLKKDYTNDELTHELLHVASIKGLNKKADEVSDILNFNGLYEGYTELLNERYFHFDYHRETDYVYEMKLAILIELIVGKKIMEKAYFSGNFTIILEELQKYLNEKDISKLSKSKINQKKYENIRHTLIPLILKKRKNEFVKK